MLLALTGSSTALAICCLDIRYLIKHSSGYNFQFQFNKLTVTLTKTVRKDSLRPPIKYPNFNFNQNLSVCYHINQYLEKIQKIRNGENQLLLNSISPHKAMSGADAGGCHCYQRSTPKWLTLISRVEFSFLKIL